MSYVTLFFKTELTCIPSILSKWLGDYYNNALCNGATWVFLLWWILHTGFNKFLNVSLLYYKHCVYFNMDQDLIIRDWGQTCYMDVSSHQYENHILKITLLEEIKGVTSLSTSRLKILTMMFKCGGVI